MARSSGRKLVFETGAGSPPTYTALAAVRTKSVQINEEEIDVTTDDEDGFVTVLADDRATKRVTISVSGVTEDDLMITMMQAGGLHHGRIRDVTNGWTITGTWIIPTLTIAGEHTGPMTFEGEFRTSGEYVIETGNP